jgi:flagellar motor switch protein FliG
MSLIIIKPIKQENYLSDEELEEAINEFYEERDKNDRIDSDKYPFKDIRKTVL